MDRLKKAPRAGWLCALLFALTIAAYSPVFFSDFVRVDDGFYVVRNPRVVSGLTWENLAWAFRTGYQGNWHPVTWISHMLDAQIYGLHPLGHHLTSLLLHATNALLILAVLWEATGALRRSFLVAALFALHPLHVESVAWVAERKDVLSTFFFLLALWSYGRYARRSGDAGRAAASGAADFGGENGIVGQPGRRWICYCLALGCFALGLMSKPMLVTLPFILLLLDYWPLDRLRAAAPILNSRLPDSSQASGSGGQGCCGAPTVRRRPLWTLWGLLVLEKVPFFALSTASSIVTFRVQQSGHAMALSLPLSARLANAVASYWRYLGKTVWPWDLAVFYPHPDARYPQSHQWPGGLIAVAAIAIGAVSLWTVLRRHRAGWLLVGWHWYLGALVPVIGLVQVGLQGMADRYTYIPLIGLWIGAVWEAEAFLRGRVSNPRIMVRIAAAMVLACAILTARQAAFWRNDLALFEHALTVTGDTALAHFHVGTGMGEQEKFKEAKAHFEAAVRADPSFAPPYYSLGLMAEAEGNPKEAIAQYRRGMELEPDSASGYYRLAWLLASHPMAEVRDGAEAVRLAQRACELTGGNEPHYLAALDAAYAEAGRFDDAIQTARKGRDLALAAGNKPLAAEAEARLALYGRRRPFRQ